MRPWSVLQVVHMHRQNGCREVRQGIIWVYRVGEVMVWTPQSNSGKEDRISHESQGRVCVHKRARIQTSCDLCTCWGLDDYLHRWRGAWKRHVQSAKGIQGVDSAQGCSAQLPRDAVRLAVSMPKYVQEIIEESGVTGRARSPATHNLFHVDENSLLLPELSDRTFIQWWRSCAMLQRGLGRTFYRWFRSWKRERCMRRKRIKTSFGKVFDTWTALRVWES